MSGHELKESYAKTYWLISKFADGMSDEDALATPPFRANSFNWVLGHIIASRRSALIALGVEATALDEIATRYATESEPAVSADESIPLSTLLASLTDSHELLLQRLDEITREELQSIYNKERSQTVAQRIAGLHWHETYHVGQLELLRQVSADRPAFP